MIALIPFLFPFLFFPTPGGFDEFAPRSKVRVLAAVTSVHELQFRDVLGQQNWYTCGAAALATWMTYYLDHPITESEVLALASAHMLARERDPKEGLTLLSLREALKSLGIASLGLRVSVESLERYFESGGLPVLIHVTRPRLHYVLAVGAHGGKVFLADPSYGRRALSFDELVRDKGFDGILLAVTVDEETERIAAQKQMEFIASFTHRYEQLNRLRTVMWR